MKYNIPRNLGVFLFVAALFSSCVEQSESDYAVIEQEVFDSWIAKHKPNLVANRQADGGYYVDLVSQGDTSLEPISDTVCWVSYDFTGYDLAGNICLTRNDLKAWQQGSFTKQTRYVPYYRLTGEGYSELEGTERAFTSELTIGEDKVLLYPGAEFTLYMPSSLVGGSGLAGEGGYEGQFSLSSGRPLVADIKVNEVVRNPLEFEGEKIDDFAERNGGVTISAESLPEDDSKADGEPATAWANTIDTLAHFYLNPTFVPKANTVSFDYENPYTSAVPDSPYFGGVADVDKLINDALIERFGEGATDGKEIGKDGDAKIWYIGRFLDGFIFDTNIDEVKQIIYGKVQTEGEAISVNATKDENSYIKSWIYTVPLLKYGQWASIVTISTYAYGAKGTVGSTDVSTSTTQDSSYYDYYNYYNSYYGTGYYDNYYSGYYNNYYNNYYYNDYYNNASNSGTTTTTTTITTEIPSYTPLIFEIYVEASEEDE